MAQSFGMNTDDEIIYRASKLRLRHNQLILRSKMASCGKQAAVMAAKHPTVNKICKSLTKYAFEGDTYAIVAPRNVEDIFIDGYVLNHCLFRSELYWDRIENHETYILFLRRRTEPDIPYYTLEVEPSLRNAAYIDTNNCYFAQQLLEQGIAKDTGLKKRSGFCEYPLWVFEEGFLREIGKENYEKYKAAYDTYAHI